MHYAEVQDEKRNVLWHGRILVSLDGFFQLLKKIRTIEKSNSQKIAGVFMNPTGNNHMTPKYFPEMNGFRGIIQMVDARRTVHLRNMTNLGKEKSDPEDAHVLALTLFIDTQSLNYLRPLHYYRGNPKELLRIRESKIENASIY